GIDAADVVYEEFTEGITRFIVVFHSTDAETVGPVRSVRPADPVIITPLGGVFAFSGGSPPIVQLAQRAPAVIVTENDTDVLRRRSGRSAPHNLYTSTEGLFSKASDEGPPPAFASFLRDGQGFAAAGAVPAAGVSVQAAPGVAADYDWDPAGGTWKRTTDGQVHTLEGGSQIAPSTVIVQFTPYTTFAADPQVRYPEVTGTGEAWIFAAGQLVRGSWAKGSGGDVTDFTDAAGAPVVLPPGQTWVHLVAPGSAVVPR
ncbi:MAG: DUF3048 domain-containing protein, partial [Actinobacteria bacterium]|nr:DUF3048 domain-containing protein [Actinomycetota bacterium]